MDDGDRLDAHSGSKNLDKRRVHRTVTGIIGVPPKISLNNGNDTKAATNTNTNTNTNTPLGQYLITLSDGSVPVP